MGNELAVARAGGISIANMFSSKEAFELGLRMANGLAGSTIIPKAYQGNVGNCVIAVEMAARLNTSPLMVMQNLYIVNGNPAWSSQWLIAMINKSDRITGGIHFELGHEKEDGGLSCFCWATDKHGERVEGPKITMKLAEAEGWTKKTGSKWNTMPEIMIRYRAAAFFARLHFPDLAMGIYTQEEIIDIGPQADLSEIMTDPTTGEIISPGVAEDPLITQEQRQALIAAAHAAYGKAEGNLKLGELIKEAGYESAYEIRTSGYASIMEKLTAAAPEADDEQPEPAKGKEQKKPEPEEDGGKLPWEQGEQQK